MQKTQALITSSTRTSDKETLKLPSRPLRFESWHCAIVIITKGMSSFMPKPALKLLPFYYKANALITIVNHYIIVRKIINTDLYCLISI